MASSTISPAIAVDTSAYGRSTPANDAAQFMDKMSNGDQQGAMQLFAQLMGVDDPNQIPPISPTDRNSYEAALVTQIGARIEIDQWAMSDLPNMLSRIKV